MAKRIVLTKQNDYDIFNSRIKRQEFFKKNNFDLYDTISWDNFLRSSFKSIDMTNYDSIVRDMMKSNLIRCYVDLPSDELVNELDHYGILFKGTIELETMDQSVIMSDQIVYLSCLKSDYIGNVELDGNIGELKKYYKKFLFISWLDSLKLPEDESIDEQEIIKPKYSDHSEIRKKLNINDNLYFEWIQRSNSGDTSVEDLIQYGDYNPVENIYDDSKLDYYVMNNIAKEMGLSFNNLSEIKLHPKYKKILNEYKKRQEIYINDCVHVELFSRYKKFGDESVLELVEFDSPEHIKPCKLCKAHFFCSHHTGILEHFQGEIDGGDIYCKYCKEKIMDKYEEIEFKSSALSIELYKEFHKAHEVAKIYVSGHDVNERIIARYVKESSATKEYEYFIYIMWYYFIVRVRGQDIRMKLSKNNNEFAGQLYKILKESYSNNSFINNPKKINNYFVDVLDFWSEYISATEQQDEGIFLTSQMKLMFRIYNIGKNLDFEEGMKKLIQDKFDFDPPKYYKNIYNYFIGNISGNVDEQNKYVTKDARYDYSKYSSKPKIVDSELDFNIRTRKTKDKSTIEQKLEKPKNKKSAPKVDPSINNLLKTGSSYLDKDKVFDSRVPYAISKLRSFMSFIRCEYHKNTGKVLKYIPEDYQKDKKYYYYLVDMMNTMMGEVFKQDKKLYSTLLEEFYLQNSSYVEEDIENFYDYVEHVSEGEEVDEDMYENFEDTDYDF